VRYTIRVTEEEAARIDSVSASAALTVSDLFRFAVLDQPPPPAARRRHAVQDAQALARLLAAVGKIGGNVNQLARTANMGGWPEAALLQQTCADIQWMRLTLMQALGVPDRDGPRP